MVLLKQFTFKCPFPGNESGDKNVAPLVRFMAPKNFSPDMVLMSEV